MYSSGKSRVHEQDTKFGEEMNLKEKECSTHTEGWQNAADVCTDD